jgi:chorismate dehydratase
LQQKLRVGAVSYLNTKPLIYGFEEGMMQEEISLVINYPSKIAAQLLNKQIDIGLIPVAVIPELTQSHIISDYCIGAVGEVYSVCLFSEVPLNQVESVLLDYQSRTSVALLKILLKEHWKVSPAFMEATEGYEKLIKGTTAGLVIGDRAIKLHPEVKYVYDLGTTWKDMTGLPFVFAAWVSNQNFGEKFITDFNHVNAFGLTHLQDVIGKIPGSPVELTRYYTQHISYRLDAPKREGLRLFLEYLNNTTA